MRPIKNNIIIEPIEYAQTASGLYIKASETEKLTATVIAVGEGTKKNPMHVKVGDTVTYRSGVNNRPIDYDGNHYLLINESHVIAIL